MQAIGESRTERERFRTASGGNVEPSDVDKPPSASRLVMSVSSRCTRSRKSRSVDAFRTCLPRGSLLRWTGTHSTPAFRQFMHGLSLLHLTLRSWQSSQLSWGILAGCCDGLERLERDAIHRIWRLRQVDFTVGYIDTAGRKLTYNYRV